MTLALALAASLLWGGSDFLGGTMSRRMAAFDVLALSQILAAVLLGGYVLATGAWRAPDPGVLWALAAGVFWTLGIGSFYSALAAGTMGVVAPIAACGVAVPVLAGLFAGDRPSAVALVGIGLGVGGVMAAAGPEFRARDRSTREVGPVVLAVLTAGKRPSAVTLVGVGLGASGVMVAAAPKFRGRDRSTRQLRPVLLAVLTACLFGFELLFLARASRSSVPLTLVTMRAASLACLGLALAVTRRGLPNVRSANLAGVLFIGVFDLAATAAYAVATRHGLVSLVAVLSSLYPAITVLLARQVHAERLKVVQTAGVAAACAGAVCIGLGGLGT